MLNKIAMCALAPIAFTLLFPILAVAQIAKLLDRMMDPQTETQNNLASSLVADGTG